MKTNNSLQKELSLVKNLIKNEIIEEDTISELYNYIFKSNGKRLRAQLSLIASSPNKRNDSEEIIFVTTQDFKIKNVATNKYLTEAEQKKVFPPDSITAYILIFLKVAKYTL